MFKFKKAIATTCVATFLFSLALPSVGSVIVYANQNDVNISFETGVEGFTPRGENTTIEQTNSVSRTGNHALRITDREASWHGAQLVVTPQVVTSAPHELSLWIRLADGEPTTNFQLSTGSRFNGSDTWHQFVGNYASATVEPGEWVELRGIFTYQNVHLATVFVETDSAGATTSFYIDDVSFTALPVHELGNISFETGTQGFEARGGDVRISRTNNQSQDGHSSLRVTRRTSAWHGTGIDVTNYISPSASHEFSLWVRLGNNQPTTNFQLSTQITLDGSQSWHQFSGPNSGATVEPGEWVELRGTFTYDAFDSVLVYIETDSYGATTSFYIDNVNFFPRGERTLSFQEYLTSLHEIYADYFLLGTAVCTRSIQGARFDFVRHHFNAVTAENYMKPDHVQNEPGVFTFERGDSLLYAAEANDITMIGHTLVWHQQSPDWLNDPNLSRQEAIANLENHITEVMTHYRGRVEAWDVVNEIFLTGIDNPEDWRSGLRDTPWLRAIGPDFIEIAFRAAHAADPYAILYYNDYNMDFPAKREAVFHMVYELRGRGVPIHGIGMQGHYNLSTNPENVRDSIRRFAELGVEISITELDVTVGPAQGQLDLTERQELEQALQYARLFQIFREYSDVIARVTLWGLDNGTSWRGDRFPLPFDRYLQATLSYHAIADPDRFLEEHQLAAMDIYSMVGEATYGTPVIDGEIDAIWESAERLNVNQFLSAWSGAHATVRTLWNENYLFALFEVTDPLLNADSVQLHEHDSVEVFIDELDRKTPFFDEGAGQYRINFNNLVSFNDNRGGSLSDRFVSATRIVSGGYIVEVQIPFLLIQGENDLVIGFEAQINDADASGQRTNIAKWNDLTDQSFQNTSGWGRLQLVGRP